MKEESRFCQYYYRDMECSTLPDDRLALPLRRRWWTLKRFVWYFNVLGPFGFVSRVVRFSGPARLLLRDRRRKVGIMSSEPLRLKPGDWVEVRSAKEVFATLDERGKLRGLAFTPEMMGFCGRRFRVFKRLDRIILEATGELRRIKTPTVLLEQVFCDGRAHGGCDRSCFCFWREEWLRKVAQ